MMANELKPRVLLLLLAAIGLITLPHIGHVPFPLSALFFGLLFWRLIGAWRPACLPNGGVIFVLALLSVGLLYGSHLGVWGRDAGTAIFVVALAVKLLELNKKRDVYLVIYLAFIVAGSQFLYQQSFAMAGYILLACCLLLAVLVAISSDQSQTGASMRTAAIIMVQALPMAVIVFALFPRVQPPAWLQMNSRSQAQSGLSETLEPGSISRLALSMELAFRVKFNGEPPPKDQLYWRGPVFSYTDGTVWHMAQNDDVMHYQDKPAFSGKAYQYNLLLEPQSRNWVFALDMPARFDAALQRNGNYQLISRAKPDEAAEYSIVSYPQYNTGYITKTEYRQNLQLPDEPSERIIDLVKQLHGFEGNPELFIQQLLDYFKRQHFSYSLQPPLLEHSSVETFLFETRSGFCSHYAAAFVYLMRVADIPARVVGGYQGGEFNEVGQFLEVRQANAHAWAEVWLDGKGWTRVDPTTAVAPERIERDINVEMQAKTGAVSLAPIIANQRGGQFGVKRAEQLWNSLDYHWQHKIVSYGRKNQSSLLSVLGGGSLTGRVLWLVALVGMAMLLLAGRLLQDRHKTEPPSLALYRQFCKKMAQAGINIRLGEGPSDFAARAKTQIPQSAELIDEITLIFVRLRYQSFSSKHDLKRLKQLINAI